MRRPITIFLFLHVVMTTSWAQAGAWLEQTGSGFLSASSRARETGTELGAYASYGLSRNLTFGLDINQSDDSGFQSAHALAFARLPLRQRKAGWQLAVELGAGLGQRDADWTPMQRLTLSAGRALSWRGRDGWLAVDLGREWHDAGDAWKLDGTLGLHRSQGPAPIVQVELYQPDYGDLAWKILPGLRWRLSPDRELLTGLEWRSFGEARLGLKVELWHRF